MTPTKKGRALMYMYRVVPEIKACKDFSPYEGSRK